MSLPLILITNDDGVNAPGLRHLIKLMNTIGKVVVVAPDGPQSAQSHAITINKPFRCNKVKIDNGKQLEFSCSGTPVDCIKLALSKILDRKPDLCVSGINHGSNASINVIYSGTMAAAIEASIHNIPSIGFSLLDHDMNADFSHTDNYILSIANKLLSSKLNRCLNVNFPKYNPESDIKGIKVAHQSKGKWIEEFDERLDPSGNKYFWLTGKFVDEDESEQADQNILDKNFVSIVPISNDLTYIDQINDLENIFNE